MQEFEAVVSGRVQMVMYRDFVQRKASGLGLTGTVQNIPDGTVRVVAQGEKEKLDALRTLLNEGPILARVDDVSVVWRTAATTYGKFSIVY